MSYQIFPIIFSRRFNQEPFSNAAKNIYERYGAMLIMVRPRRPLRSRSTNVQPEDAEIRIAPFESRLHEGYVAQYEILDKY